MQRVGAALYNIWRALYPALIAELLFEAAWFSAWVSPFSQSVIGAIGYVWFIAIPKIIAFAVLLPIFLKERGRERALGAERHAMTLNGILTAAAFLIAWYIIWTIFAEFSGVTELYISSISPEMTAPWQYEASSPLSRVTLSIVIAPFLEELTFRGLMQKRLQRVAPAWVAILVSAALFAVLHWNWYQAIHTFVGGLLLGTLYAKYKNLLIPIIGHMVYNLASEHVAFLLILPAALAVGGIMSAIRRRDRKTEE